MRLLFDENFPAPILEEFVGHDCDHVIAVGWSGIKNGELLNRAESAGYEALITFDSNIPKQNDLSGRKIAVLVLKPQGQGLQATRALLSEALAALSTLRRGHSVTISNRKSPGL